MEYYNGIYIRDTLGDMGTIPSVTGSPTYSPDIICYQDSILSLTDAQISYGKYICKPFKQDGFNNIYIRARNINNEPRTGKVRAYYAPINLLYTPKNWTALELPGGGREVELTSREGCASGVGAGEKCLCNKAFFLDSVKEPEKHHCMMGLVSNADGSFQELPEDFVNDNGLWEFLRMHPQIAYNNITIEMPEKRIFTMPVQYGNYDEEGRRYCLSVEVLNGLDTLAGASVIAQSTSTVTPFSFNAAFQEGQRDYSFEYTLKTRCSDYMEFAVVMPDYDKVKAALHVRNFAVNTAGDAMEPEVAVRYARDVDDTRGEGKTATMLGDFFLYLGENLDNVRPILYSEKKPLELPGIHIAQRF